MSFNINNRSLLKESVFFIADIGANHDGSIDKAIDLINLASEAGADAVKFQHFKAETIVSDYGFKNLNSDNNLSHQSKWKKSVFEVYKDASISLDWTEKIKKECDRLNITFFTSPYSLELVDYIDEFVGSYKIGSGDITWIEIIEKIAKKNKPTFLATGASNMKEVEIAVSNFIKHNKNLCLMQCNTNYTGSDSNFKYVNLNVLKTFRKKFPDLTLGLSDHTKGHTTVLGAVALGAKAIEKHFTDNNSNDGPDHFFAMDPLSWKNMVEETRNLEKSMGKVEKIIESNEKETVILQRRSIRLNKNIKAGYKLNRSDLIPLRPCPIDAIKPDCISKLIGKKTNKELKIHDYIKWEDIE